MKKITIQNLLEDLVLKELKDNYYITGDDIVNIFEKYCDNSEDLDEILDIVANSKKYNHIICTDDSYYFGKKRKQIKNFIKFANISDKDDCWTDFIYCEDSIFERLYQFTDEFEKTFKD